MSEPNNAQTVDELDAGIVTVIDGETILANAQYQVWPNCVAPNNARYNVRGKSVSFPKLEALTPVVDELDATENPASANLADDLAEVILREYGLPVDLQKKVLKTSQIDAIRDIVRALTQNQAESVDAIAGVAALGGTAVRYADGVANNAGLLAGSIFDRNEIIAAVATLTEARAPVFADGTYMAILHPRSISDLFASGANLGDFTDVAKYANPDAIRTGEIGKMHGCTFFRASQRNVTVDGAGAAGGGNTLGDLIKNLVCGAGYLGYAEGEAPAVAYKPSGDRMDRFLSFYWKGLFGFGRIKEGNAVRIHCRSAFGDNP